MPPVTAARAVPRGTLRRRLLLAVVAVLVPVVFGALLSVTLLTRASTQYEQLAHEYAAEASSTAALLRDLTAAEKVGQRYLAEGDRGQLVVFRQLRQRIDAALASGGRYDEVNERDALAKAERSWDTASSQTARPGAASRMRFEQSMDDAIANVTQVLHVSEIEIARDLDRTEQLERVDFVLRLLALALALVAAGYLARGVSRSIAKPLGELAQAARALSRGELSHRVATDTTTTAELFEVGETFNAMADAIEQQHADLERSALLDRLTGLANRALFEDRLRHAVARLQRTTTQVAVLMVDIDGFKLVNDGLGHESGDSLLVTAAQRMKSSLRPADTLARLGGDEFAVLLEHMRGPEDALGAAERLRRSLEAPFDLSGSEVSLSASIGIALSTRDVQDPAELLRRADLAMYRVKARGKNACEFYDVVIEDQAAERLETLNGLRRAIERQELVLHYQPIVDLQTGDIRAVEALLRWNRRGRELVPPGSFIPLAEESGLIVELGAWVLRTACKDAARWGEIGPSPVPVTVNVSARQLNDPNLESVVFDALRTSGIETDQLILEVTESALMLDREAATAKLVRISRRGVAIALDDFGEGYSSLGQLRDLPISMLKIARPFIKGLTGTAASHDPALVHGVIELSRGLGLRLVAEGIETTTQHALLREMDCPLGQGFHFARPMEAHALCELLAHGHGHGGGGAGDASEPRFGRVRIA